MLWSFALQRLVKAGHLTVIDAFGKRHTFGVPGDEPRATVRLHDKRLHLRLAMNPDLYLGEAYMDKTLTIDEGDLHEFFTLLAINIAGTSLSVRERAAQFLLPILRRFQQYNPVGKAQENVAHHYDLSQRLYDLFLDKDLQYTCAYLRDESNSLDQAQYDKKRHIAAKLLLKPGMKVLDAGCGYGGLALYLAKTCGVEVVGVTLSREQHRVASERAKQESLSGQVKFHLLDYREVEGSFDRVVSIGMMEHIGAVHYAELFNHAKRLMVEDGIALFHSLGRMDGPGTTYPWLRKYIFPGGYAPALSEVLAVIERSGLWVTDIEILRMHYVYTLRHWRKRFFDNYAEICALYDERFMRMWEFYLVGAEMDLHYLHTMVFHIQLAKRIDVVPLTRDYMFDWERSHP